MDWKQRAAAVQAQMTHRQQQGARGRVPEVLKAEALECLRGRAAQGATAEQVAAELGVSPKLLERWAAGVEVKALQRAPASFHAVQVVAEPELTPAQGALVVHGPGGVRVEGLQFEQVVQLLRRLGR